MSSLHSEGFEPGNCIHSSVRNIREDLDLLKRNFIHYFSGLGYIEYAPVKISSGIDKSVRFIGSHISLFKKGLLENAIPRVGFVVVQPCIRTWNQKKLFDDDYLPIWGSYFPSLGAVKGPEKTEEISIETFDFFTKFLKIPFSDLIVRVNSKDTDLLDICRKYFGEEQIEINSFPDNYYRHKYGIEGVTGRNFNIAIKDVGKNTFSDVGNIISIDRGKKVIGVESALGATTILKQLLQVEHVNDFLTISGIFGKEEIKRKFEDAIAVSIVLLSEGLRPNSSSNTGRILKSYINSLCYYRAKLHMEMNTLQSIIREFELIEVGKSKNCTKMIIDYLKNYEKELKDKKGLSKEDEIIKEQLS